MEALHRSGLKFLTGLTLAIVATALPAQNVPGHAVETWAVGLTTGVSLSFDPSGHLYVGHEDNGTPTRIWRIHAQASSCAPPVLYGDTDLPDPDVAVFDPLGVASGAAGSVLVGGACSGQGCIWAVRSDETTFTLLTSGAFSNVSAMVLDPAGHLLFTSGSDRGIHESSGPGQVATLFTLPATSSGIDLDPVSAQTIVSSAADGVIRRHDRVTGTTTVLAALPAARRSVIRYARGGPFGTSLYAVETGVNGSLYRIDSNGAVTVVGSGFIASGLTFGPDGAMYLTQRPGPTTGATMVLRIVPAPNLPSVPGHSVSVFASGLSTGVSLSFDPAGNLFVGHEDNGTPTRIWRVAAGAPPSGPHTLYGDTPLPDPDQAITEPAGLVSGVPGSVLVGGNCGTGGCIWAIHPDQTTITAVSSAAFSNVSAMALDPAGHLLFCGGSDRRIYESAAPGQVSTLFTLPATSSGIDPDPASAQTIVSSAADGVIRRHDRATGTTSVLAMLPAARGSAIRYARGGPFGSSLYAIETGLNGSLYQIAADGTVTSLGSGFLASGLTFGPDGALYVTVRTGPTTGATNVLRILPHGTQACFGNYGSGTEGTSGVPPLTLSAAPVLGATISLLIGNSLGVVTNAWLLVGDTPASIPTGIAGQILVQPAAAAALQLPGPGLAAPVTIPAALPAGLSIYLQVFEEDPGALSGWSASLGLAATIGI